MMTVPQCEQLFQGDLDSVKVPVHRIFYAMNIQLFCDSNVEV